jgi:hypothetical protein
LCEVALAADQIERLITLCRDCERLPDASILALTAAAEGRN